MLVSIRGESFPWGRRIGQPCSVRRVFKTFVGDRRLYVSDERMCILFDRYAEMIGAK